MNEDKVMRLPIGKAAAPAQLRIERRTQADERIAFARAVYVGNPLCDGLVLERFPRLYFIGELREILGVRREQGALLEYALPGLGRAIHAS